MFFIITWFLEWKNNHSNWFHEWWKLEEFPTNYLIPLNKASLQKDDDLLKFLYIAVPMSIGVYPFSDIYILSSRGNSATLFYLMI